MAENIERRLSFNGGEISPWVEPRIDLDKYRSSCRQLTNFRPNVYGSAFKRWGTQYMGGVKTSSKMTRLVAFEFSATDSMVLEFGENYIAFWTTGVSGAQVESGPGVAYEVATSYLESELFELQFVQQNDTIYISHPNHWPRILSRLATDSWTIADIAPEWPAVRDENITTTTLAASAVTGTGITVTASASLFNANQVGGYWLITHRRDTPYVEMDLNAAAATATTSALYVLGEWSLSVNSSSAGFGTWAADVIVQRSYDKTTWETLRTSTSNKSAVQSTITGTEIEPAWLRIYYQTKTGTPPAGMRASLEAVDPNHYGIVKVTDFNSATSVDADVIWELASTGATKRWNESAWSDYRGHPRAVTIHQQRLFFGGNEAQPQTLWASIIDDYANFRSGSEDDLGLALTLASDASNSIQWLVSQEDLAIGTTGAEWILKAGDTERTLTPSNASARRSTNYGSSYLQARAVNDATLFIQRSGRRLREFIFAFERDGYVSPDLTLLAEHLATGSILQIDVQKSPETVVWCITGDKQLIGMTYERQQEVTCWHEHVTGAAGDGFESVAVVPTNNDEDEVWFVVKREIDGATARYIERWPLSQLETLRAATSEDLVYLDSSITYSGSSTTTISNLDHLEGETVCALSEGALVEGLTVASGSVTLPEATTKAIVGIDYTATLEPTYFATNDPGSVSKVGKMRLTRAIFDLWNSLGLEVSTDGGATFDEVDFRDVTDNMDEVPPLFTGLKEKTLAGGSERLAALIVRHRQPFPLNLRSLYVRGDLNAQ